MAHRVNVVVSREITVTETEKSRAYLAEVIERHRRRMNGQHITPEGNGCARVYHQRIFLGWRAFVDVV